MTGELSDFSGEMRQKASDDGRQIRKAKQLQARNASKGCIICVWSSTLPLRTTDGSKLKQTSSSLCCSGVSVRPDLR